MHVIVHTEINECESDPCQNGASCVDRLGKYRCTCVFGYTGVNCETSKSHNTTTTSMTLTHTQLNL